MIQILIISKDVSVSKRKLKQIKKEKEIRSDFYLVKEPFFKVDNELRLVTYDDISYEVVTSPPNLICGRRVDMLLVDYNLKEEIDNVESDIYTIERYALGTKLPREVRLVYFKDEEE